MVLGALNFKLGKHSESAELSQVNSLPPYGIVRNAKCLQTEHLLI